MWEAVWWPGIITVVVIGGGHIVLWFLDRRLRKKKEKVELTWERRPVGSASKELVNFALSAGNGYARSAGIETTANVTSVLVSGRKFRWEE